MANETGSMRLYTLLGDAPRVPRAARRLLRGVGWSLLFGAALGTRYGLGAVGTSAVAAPLALVALAALAAPTLYIAMAHAGSDIAASDVGQATADCVETAGRTLAGLSPALLLISSSAESDWVASATYALGFMLAIGLGLRSLRTGLSSALGRERRLRSLLIVYGFSGFCWLFAGRIWWAASPVLSGEVSP